jgi:NitT/TauT family transport system ATP-binding protein
MAGRSSAASISAFARHLELDGTGMVMAATDQEVDVTSVDLTLGNQSILKGIDLSIRRREFVCVVGPSGCGKTSLLRLLAGLYQPTRGAVSYRGTAMTKPRQDIAVVFQDYGKALLPWRTAHGNIALALEAIGSPRETRDRRITDLLAKVGLAGQEDKYPSQMSGGMQQRLQIARCLAQEPSALMTDEPFGALDAMTRQTLQDQILDIARATNATIFFVTHDLEEAIYLGDRVIGLMPHPGRVGLDVAIDLPRPRN